MELVETVFGPVQKYGTGAIKVVFAHGSGIGMNHDFMQSFATAMSIKDFTVYLFEFGYMQQIQKTGIKRPPPNIAKLEIELLALLDALTLSSPLIIGGKSLGSRVASLIVDQTNALGWFALGYPFHPQHKPDAQRVAHLLTSQKPALIVQGTRDALGSYDEVLGYKLPKHINLRWLSHMDHSFKPFKASHYSQNEAIERAAMEIEQWAHSKLKHTVPQV